MEYDAVIVGSGPNGLSAALRLAQEGWRTLVLEGASELGGGARTTERTLPGYLHDVCSAVHPLGAGSPFFRRLPLERHGLEWIHPPLPLAHPFDDGSAAVLDRSLERTARGLGPDSSRYRDLVEPVVEGFAALMGDVLAPLRLPAHPVQLARFGLVGLQPASRVAARFRAERARALFTGIAAHAMVPLDRLGTAAFGLVLGASAHVVGWPFPRGGAGRIAGALAGHLRELGGSVAVDRPVGGLGDLPPARAWLFDVTPRQLLALAGERFPPAFRRRLQRYRYGIGAFKIDWALDGPIPWRAPECARAGTVHLGGPSEEVAAALRAPWEGRVAERPFVLLTQPSLFDPSRAPAGRHVAWAYCHVPLGSTRDVTEALEAQVERFAPGFRERILARATLSPAGLERHNPNLVGGDINGGVQDLRQLFRRPTWRFYATPAKDIYICSASTPPGGGVHGMCGFGAAERVLLDHGTRRAGLAGSRSGVVFQEGASSP